MPLERKQKLKDSSLSVTYIYIAITLQLLDVTQDLEARRGTLDGRDVFALNPRVEIDQLQHDRSAELHGLFPRSSVKGERRVKGLNRDKLAGPTFKAETCFFSPLPSQKHMGKFPKSLESW